MAARVIKWMMCGVLGIAVQTYGAASPQQLREIVQQHLGERDHWAFTQRAVEYDRGVRYERTERFDPTRSGQARWELIAINGMHPTQEQRQKWAEKKFKRRPRNIDTPIGDFFDFQGARVVSETEDVVRFDIPLNRSKSWLFPVEKVDVRITLNKRTQALEHVTAEVTEPFRVLLGIARVNAGQLQLDFGNPGQGQPVAAAGPSGTARVSVLKFGERVDFTWTDFKRVVPGKSDPKQAERQTKQGWSLFAWFRR